MSKSVQLTVSGCLGPCDVVNVVRLSSEDGDVWLGNLKTLEDYLALVDWAERSKGAGEPAPLSPQMDERRFSPFRRAEVDFSGPLESKGNP